MIGKNQSNSEDQFRFEFNITDDEVVGASKTTYIPIKEVNAHIIDEDQELIEQEHINLKLGHIPDSIVEEESIEEELSLDKKELTQEKPARKQNSDNAIDNKNNNEYKDKTPVEYEVFKMLLERYEMKCLKGSLYLYSENNGCFSELTEIEIRTLVRKGWSNRIESLLSKSRVDDIIDRLKSHSDIQIAEDELNPYHNLINFNDCVLDVTTGNILSHSPRFLFSNYINANYNSTRREGKNFNTFIYQCTNGDKEKISQIQQIIGYTISNYTTAKRWFAFIGEPHTGKSTILDLLTEIIGEEYTSNVPLHELSERFSLADLFKKKLNVCGEISDSDIKNISTIKALTGNDRVRADVKYKSAINFINRAKIIMAGNKMPQIKTTDNTTAFIDRILFVVFNNSIPENQRDYKLKEKLLSERDYIVQWAIEGLLTLINKNFIFTQSKDSIDYKNLYHNEMTNVKDFINIMCTIDLNNKRCRVHKRDLYACYIKYGRDNCQSILEKKEFFSEIKKLHVKQAKFRFKKSTPLDGYIGISLKKEYEYE